MTRGLEVSRGERVGERMPGTFRSGLVGVGRPLHRSIPRREVECRRLLDALRETGAASIRRRHAPGEGIYRTGEDGGALYVITAGVARLSAEYTGYTRGREATLRLMGPWELFGYPVFSSSVRRASAEAVTDCEVTKVSRAFLERAMRERPEVRFALMVLMELALVEQEALLACLLPRKTETRLARLLPILLGKFGEEDGESVGLRLTREDLAAMVASTRESVTAAITRLRDRGIIAVRKGRIAVLDSEALAEAGAA